MCKYTFTLVRLGKSSSKRHCLVADAHCWVFNDAKDPKSRQECQIPEELGAEKYSESTPTVFWDAENPTTLCNYSSYFALRISMAVWHVKTSA